MFINKKKLLFVWIENHKNIKEYGFHISDKYEFNVTKKNDTYAITYKENPEYKPNILFGSNINIKAVIGKNGAGKSALLEAIYGLSSNFVFLIFEEENDLKGYYITSGKHQPVVKSEFEFSKIHNADCVFFSGIRNADMQQIKEPYYFAYSDNPDKNDIYKRLSQILAEDENAFDFLDDFGKFRFNKFRKSVSSKKTNNDINIMHREKFGGLKNIELISFIPYNSLEYEKLDYIYYGFLKPDRVEHDVSQIVVLNFLQEVNNIFRTKEVNSKNLINKYYELALGFHRPFSSFNLYLWIKFVEEVIKLFKEFNVKADYDDLARYAEKSNFTILDFLDDSQLFAPELNKEYKNFSDTKTGEIEKLNEFEIGDFQKCKNQEDEKYNKLLALLKECLPSRIYDSLFDDFYNFADKRYSYEQLSQGEKTLLKLFLDLYSIYKGLYQNLLSLSVILLDEVEITFHPEWKRKYIYYINSFLEKIFPDNENIFNILLTTHSPYVLSDLAQDNIIKLDNEDNICKMKKITKKTFASNMQCMLNDSFFLNNNIGEFAEWKIRNLIEEIKSENLRQKAEKIEDMINLTGDDVIKSILKSQLERSLYNAES